jgi:hypothetical protein
MKTYLGAFLVLLAVAVANYVGQVYDVALKVPFYDVYLHLAGGLGIGLMLSALHRSFFPSHTTSTNGRWLIVFSVLCVGLVWELFEAYFNIAGAPVGTKAYYIDTIKDLCDDIIGGGLGVYLLSRSYKKTQV